MNSEGKFRTTVDIFGTTYRMVGTLSQTYLNQLSAYINENMSAIAKSNPRLDAQRVAVKALLSMADDYFRLRGKWDAVGAEREQAQRHMEELRKAFELIEEKERVKSGEAHQLWERVETLEKDNVRLAQETELASRVWAERVEEWETKAAAAEQEAKTVRSRLEARVGELEQERNELASEAGRLRQEAEAAKAAAAAARNPFAREREPEPVKAQTAPAGTVPETKPAGAAAEVAAAGAGAPVDEPTLLEKYRKLQEEYAKLQNEFNEWIQLTQSETQ